MLRKMVYVGTLTASFTAGWRLKAWYDEKMGAARPLTIVAKVSKLWDGVTKGDPKDRQIRELRDKVRERDRHLAGCRAKYDELRDAYIVSLQKPFEDRGSGGNQQHDDDRGFKANNKRSDDRGSNLQHDHKNPRMVIQRSDDDRSNQHEIYDLPPPQRRP